MANMLGLLYLASPTLPIGSFAYSQGLEKAIENEIVKDRASLLRWCEDFISIGLAHLDLPLLRRINHALLNTDQQQLEAVNALVFASRETSELHMEEVNLGQSLKRLIRTQDCFHLHCGYEYHSHKQMNVSGEKHVASQVEKLLVSNSTTQMLWDVLLLMY